MRKRGMLVVCLLLAWTSVYAFTRRTDVSDKAVTDAIVDAIDTAPVAWSKETMFYVTQNFPRRTPLFQVNQTGPDAYRNQSRIRVLVLGDSYTEGTGIADNDARWWRRMEEVLDGATAPGTFEVAAVALPGTSLYTYADWAQKIARGDLERIAGSSTAGRDALAGPFDVVVIGFVDNDIVANADDWYIPESDRPTGMEQEVDQVAAGEVDRPYLRYAATAPADIKRAIGAPLAVWMPLTGSDVGTNPRFRWSTTFSGAGWVLARNANARNAQDTLAAADVMATPNDYHPSPAMHLAYAKDAAEAVLGNIDPQRLTRAMAGASPAERPEISNYLPNEMQVRRSGTGSWQLSFDPDLGAIECGAFMSQTGSTRCTASQTMEYVIDGMVYPAQTSGCAAINRPNTQVMFSRDASQRSAVLRFSRLTEPVEVWGISYDQRGVQVSTPLARVSAPSSVDVPAATNGVYIASTRQGCPADGFSAPGFTAEVVWGR